LKVTKVVACLVFTTDCIL